MTSVLDRPAPPPDLTVRYGGRPEHVIDVRLPSGGLPSGGLPIGAAVVPSEEFARTH